MSSAVPDRDLKARHRVMWASGDYSSMVETFLLPLGPALFEACDIGSGMRVLDVAAGTGNASIPGPRRPLGPLVLEPRLDVRRDEAQRPFRPSQSQARETAIGRRRVDPRARNAKQHRDLGRLQQRLGV